MVSSIEAPSTLLWDVLIFLYLMALMLSPIVVRWRWGLKPAMHWVGTEFLIVLEVAILAFLIFEPALPLPFDPNTPPPIGTGFLVVISRVLALGFFVLMSVGVPVMAVVAGAALALMWSALGHAWRSVLGRRDGD
jgi:hypothetical protein